MKQVMRVAKLVFAMGVLVALCGCHAKYVRTSTGSSGQTKFLYTQGSETGIIKCDTNDETGALSNCREMQINYKE